MADLPELNSLNLSGNRFTGCIPRGLADIEQNDLHHLRLPACPAPGIPKLTIPDDLEIRPYREISITLTFDQPVAGITTDAPIVNAGTTTSVTGSGTAWTITILPTEIAPITVSLPQGAGLDQHGEPTPASAETVIGIPYDDDHNGEISKSEAITAVIEFFANLITKEQAIDVIILYFTS